MFEIIILDEHTEKSKSPLHIIAWTKNSEY